MYTSNPRLSPERWARTTTRTGDRKVRSGIRLIAQILGTALLASGCSHSNSIVKTKSAAAPRPQVDTSLARYIRKHAPSDEVVCYDKPCAVELFLPGPEHVASLKKRLGDGAYLALDDAGWYSHAARQILEEYGTPVFLPLADTVRFEGARKWTLGIRELRDQSAYVLFHPRRGLKMVPAEDINKETLENFFAQ